MVDHKNTWTDSEQLDRLVTATNTLETKHEELWRKVCELDTRIGNMPRPIPERLVPRVAYPSVSERLLQQTARDRLSKIAHLEAELAGRDEALTDANVKIEDYSKKLGEALLERDHYKAVAADRLDTLDIVRAQLREADMAASDKTKALANSERELQETKAVVRSLNDVNKKLSAGKDAMSDENGRLRSAHATACTEVSKLTAARDGLSALLLTARDGRDAWKAAATNREATVKACNRTVESLRQEIADLRDGGGSALDDEPALPGIV